MAAYSPMLARRRLMKRGGAMILDANRWNLVTVHCLFSTAADPIVHKTGTNQCFLMNYIGSVCEM